MPLPSELAAVELPVVLLFGLVRPYKGSTCCSRRGARSTAPSCGSSGCRAWTRAAARPPPPGVRFVERFVADAELPAFFDRADLVVLPYREIDQSGVLFTALAFGKPLVLTAVGGFPEVAGDGRGRARAARRPGRAGGGAARAAGRPGRAGRLAAAAPRGRRPAPTAGTPSRGATCTSMARCVA